MDGFFKKVAAALYMTFLNMPTLRLFLAFSAYCVYSYDI